MTRPKSIKLPYKLLIYDIETSLMLCYLFSLGEQTVRHNQLLKAFCEVEIICIAAKWYGEKEIFLFKGDGAIEEFDALARQADVCMGKNSDSFDVKHINTLRMTKGLKPYPEWMDTNDDLEKICRKHFRFPSQSLDYISQVFGLGGKEKMEFTDWVDIKNYRIIEKIESVMKLIDIERTGISKALFNDTYSEIKRKGDAALVKMYFYNKKDVKDTEDVLTKILPYVRLKHNSATGVGGLACITCGGTSLAPTKVIIVGKIKYQQFDCLDHDGYAGRATWKYLVGSHHRTYGKIG